MRIGGLASGMDIDSIVAKMMEAQRAPLDKLQQQKQTYEWQRDAFRTMNKNAKTLSEYMSDNMTRQSSLIKKSVTTSNDAVTATANADAAGSLQITKVENLATSATIKTKGRFIKNNIGEASNTKLVDSSIGLELFKDGATSHELKMKVLKDNGKMEDVTINITNEDTIGTMVSKFNASSTGLNAFYDEHSGSLSISTKATGVGTVPFFSESTTSTGGEIIPGELTHSLETSMYAESGGSFLKALGFNEGGNLTRTDLGSNADSVVSKGSNAKLVYNGLEIERNSNTFNLAGYQVTLNKTYTEQAPITLKATTDVDHFINKVEEFVNKYNEFIKSTHGAINETKNRKYAPLTEEQKKDMSEDEIEKWEKIAKSGVIRRDQTVASGLQNLRSIIYSNAGATGKKYDTLSEIGITTTKSYSDGGLLELNKDKLREAILADEEAVFKVFSNSTEGEPEGVIQQMRKSLENFQTSIKVKAGHESVANNTFTIGRNMDNVDSRIKTWENKLKMMEERYWSQFTAMEKAISKANEQSSLFGTTTAQ